MKNQKTIILKNFLKKCKNLLKNVVLFIQLIYLGRRSLLGFLVIPGLSKKLAYSLQHVPQAGQGVKGLRPHLGEKVLFFYITISISISISVENNGRLPAA